MRKNIKKEHACSTKQVFTFLTGFVEECGRRITTSPRARASACTQANLRLTNSPCYGREQRDSKRGVQIRWKKKILVSSSLSLPPSYFPLPLTTQRKPIIDNIFLKAARLILLILSLRIAPPSSSPPKSKHVRLFLLSSLSLLVKFEHTMSKVRRRSCLILSGLSDEFVNYEAYQSHHLHNLRFCKQITGKKNELLCRSFLKN